MKKKDLEMKEARVSYWEKYKILPDLTQIQEMLQDHGEWERREELPDRESDEFKIGDLFDWRIDKKAITSNA